MDWTSPTDYLIPAIWIAWLAYWLIAAVGAKATTRAESPGSRMLHTVPLGVGAWMIMAKSLPHGFLGAEIVPRSPVLLFTGIAILILGLAFSVWARLRLGRNWSGVVTLKRDHELVRSGPYRHVRHPIYTGILLGLIGTAIARDEWRGVVGVAIAWLALWRKWRLEERWMVEQFGEAYRQFQADTPALIPNPFRRGRSASR